MGWLQKAAGVNSKENEEKVNTFFKMFPDCSYSCLN